MIQSLLSMVVNGGDGSDRVCKLDEEWDMCKRFEFIVAGQSYAGEESVSSSNTRIMTSHQLACVD